MTQCIRQYKLTSSTTYARTLLYDDASSMARAREAVRLFRLLSIPKKTIAINRTIWRSNVVYKLKVALSITISYLQILNTFSQKHANGAHNFNQIYINSYLCAFDMHLSIPQKELLEKKFHFP